MNQSNSRQCKSIDSFQRGKKIYGIMQYILQRNPVKSEVLVTSTRKFRVKQKYLRYHWALLISTCIFCILELLWVKYFNPLQDNVPFRFEVIYVIVTTKVPNELAFSWLLKIFAVLLISNKTSNHYLLLYDYKAQAVQKQGFSKGFDSNQPSKKDKRKN